MAVLSARFRLIDEMSGKLDAIARSGEAAVQRINDIDSISGSALDTTTASVDSAADALNNFERETIEAASAVDKLTNTGDAAERAFAQEVEAANNVSAALNNTKTYIDDLTKALDNEASKLEKSAAEAQRKADIDTKLAERARDYYERLKLTVTAEGELSDELNKSAQAALLEAERLEKAAAASRIKADRATAAAKVTRANADEMYDAAMAAGELTAKTDRATDSLDTFSNTGKTAADALEDVAETAKTYNSYITESAQTAENFRSSIRAQEEELSKLQEAYVGVALSSDKNSDSAKALKTQIDSLSSEITKNKKALDSAEQSAGKFGSTSVDSIQQLSQALAAAGIIKALNGIYDAFANAVNKAIEFESAITGVHKTVDGTSEQLSQISSEVKAMSVAMPASAIEIAGVAEAAGQLGIATGDITAFTEVMINLGEATNLSADEAASALAKFTNITGMAAANYENLGSTVVALGNSFATTEADIVAMSTRMASAGTLAGLTEPEILALAAAMSSVGIEADAGGSAMSKLLTDIQVAVETGSDRLEEFASVAGMTGREFADVFGNSASDALYSFITGLNDVERNGATATVILEDMGITEVRLSNAIKSLANNSEGLSSAIGVANSAWSANTALANEAGLRYGTLESRINMTQNAADNLAAAIGDDLTPAVGFFVDAGRGALEWFTGVVEKYPAVSAGLTAVAVGVGIVAGAVTIFALVTSPLVIGAINAITAAMMANPIFLIITGVVALTAAVVAFVAIMASQKSEYDTWTASTKNQYDELQQLNAEYENAVEVYGETSDEALALRYEVDELTAAFEESKISVEQFVAECDKLVESHNKIVSSYMEATEKLDYEAQGTMALIHKLEQLGSKTEITAAEQEQMKAIIDQLNKVVPDLALNYNDVTDSLDTTIASLQKMAQEQATQEKQAENYRTYVDLLKEQTALEEKLAAAEANLTAERERRGMYYDEQMQQWTNGWYTETSPWASWTTDLDDYNNALSELQTAYDENLALQEKLTNEMGEYAQQAEEAKAVTVTYGEAVTNALNSIQAEMDELTAKYDESYEAARNNIDSVIGLFDTMKTETKLSIDDMTAALQSQSEYLATYTENLRKAAEYGLDDGLIASLSDGSAESAGQLDAIIGKIEELGATTQDAASFVSSFNDQFSEVQKAKDEFATTVAEMQTDFSAKMDEMEKKLTESIDNMNMETEAAAAAKDTMQAYINAIRAQQANAVSAAEAVANATAAALSKTPPITASSATTPTTTRGYATGTESAERGLALVGEEGPELIDFSGGEKVYTAPETEKILNARAEITYNLPEPAQELPLPENSRELSLPDRSDGETTSVFYLPKETGADSNNVNTFMNAPEPSAYVSKSEKKITLEIEGNGAIQIDSNVDEESILQILFSNLRPALLSLVRQEIFEEGELAHDF